MRLVINTFKPKTWFLTTSMSSNAELLRLVIITCGILDVCYDSVEPVEQPRYKY